METWKLFLNLKIKKITCGIGNKKPRESFIINSNLKDIKIKIIIPISLFIFPFRLYSKKGIVYFFGNFMVVFKIFLFIRFFFFFSKSHNKNHESSKINSTLEIKIEKKRRIRQNRNNIR